MRRLVGKFTIFSIIVLVLVAMMVSGCTYAPTAQPPNRTYVVNVFGPNPTQYVTTNYSVTENVSAENILYGRLTMNGTTPPGYVYQVRPSTFYISQSDEPVDAIGLVKASTIFYNITSIDNPNEIYGASSDADQYGLVDPQGNFQINNLTSAMYFVSYMSFGPPDGNNSTIIEILPFDMPGGNISIYFIRNNVNYGSVYYYPTANVSHVDLDLTDVKFQTDASDRWYSYYKVNGTLKK